MSSYLIGALNTPYCSVTGLQSIVVTVFFAALLLSVYAIFSLPGKKKEKDDKELYHL